MKIATQYQLMMPIRQFNNASGAIGWPKLQPMQVAPSGDQIYKNVSSAIWWSNFPPIQTSNAIKFWLKSVWINFGRQIFLKLWTQYPGPFVPLAMFIPQICKIAIKRRAASCQSGSQSVKVAIFLPLHTAPFNTLHQQQLILPMKKHQHLCI